MKVAVVGTGYVGLVSGTCFAEVGNEVTCVDIDQQKVTRMQHGEVPIYEPGLEAMFKRNVDEGRLHFTSDLAEGIRDAAIIFLALPTPPGEDGSADLSYVLGAAADLGAPLIVATSASLLAGFIVSFTLNRQWVFNAGSKNAQKRATLQLVLYATLFVANTAIAYFFIDYMHTLGMHPLIAKLLSIVMITTWNYLIYKKVIFRLKDPDPQQAAD